MRQNEFYFSGAEASISGNSFSGNSSTWGVAFFAPSNKPLAISPAPPYDPRRTVRALFDLMLNGRLGKVANATYNNARSAYKNFSKWMGAEGMNASVCSITRATIREWVDYRRTHVRCLTTKKNLSSLSCAFSWAVDAGWMPANPCTKINVPPDTNEEKQKHEAFTPQEVRRLLRELPEEWASAVHCCLGTYGQRLGDVLSLRWEQFDWESQIITLTTGKTRHILTLPMSKSFYKWARITHALATKIGGDASIYVHPNLRKLKSPSPRFTKLVRQLGIGKTESKAGGARRNWHNKTFHSLRATVATQMHAAGISQGMAMRLIGHDSVAAHEVYIRPSLDELAFAAAKLPEW